MESISSSRTHFHFNHIVACLSAVIAMHSKATLVQKNVLNKREARERETKGEKRRRERESEKNNKTKTSSELIVLFNYDNIKHNTQTI